MMSSSPATVATSSLAPKRCSPSGTLFSGSRRPVTLPASSRFFRIKAHDPFYGVFDKTIASHPKRQVHSLERISDMSRDIKFKINTDAIHLRIFMPGVRKENTKVWVENDKLIAEGKKDKDFVDDEENYALKFGVSVPMQIIKANEITSEMKNGSLKVRLPFSIIVKD